MILFPTDMSLMMFHDSVRNPSYHTYFQNKLPPVLTIFLIFQHHSDICIRENGENGHAVPQGFRITECKGLKMKFFLTYTSNLPLPSAHAAYNTL